MCFAGAPPRDIRPRGLRLRNIRHRGVHLDDIRRSRRAIVLQPTRARARLLVPLSLCTGLLVVPLLALNNGGPRSPGGAVRVAAGAPGVAAPSPAPPAQVMDAELSIAGGDTTTGPVSDPARAVAAPATVTTHPAPARTTAAATVHAASVERTYTTNAPTTTAPPPPPRHTQTGEASWYDTTPGTCAHQTLPFGTVVTIIDVDNGRRATCTVEDRGPYVTGRIIDLAPDVFSEMAPTSSGVVNVQISWSS